MDASASERVRVRTSTCTYTYRTHNSSTFQREKSLGDRAARKGCDKGTHHRISPERARAKVLVRYYTTQ